MEYQTKRKDRFLVHHEKNVNTILSLLYILVNVLKSQAGAYPVDLEVHKFARTELFKKL